MPSTVNNIKAIIQHPSFRKWLKRIGITLLISILIGIVVWVFFRGNILNAAWNRAANGLKAKGYELQCTEKGFDGLFTIQVKGLSLERNKEALVKSENISAGIDIWGSIISGPTLASLELSKTHINLYKNASGCNYCGLSSGKKQSTESKEPLTQRLFNLIKKALAKTPGNIELADFKLRYNDSGETYGLDIPSLSYRKKDLKGSLRIWEGNIQSGFAIAGTLDRKQISGKVQITPESGDYAELPLIRKRFNVKAGFSKADFEITELDMTGGVLEIQADGHIQNAIVDDRRLADTSVIFKNCSGKLVARIGNNFLEIDSATSLSLNKINTRLYAKAETGEHKQYTLMFSAPRMKANDFFQSLPVGMFNTVKGITAEGELEYRMFMHIDGDKPYDCVFQSELKPYGFKLAGMGAANLNKMNGEFTHTFYERGKAVRSFKVGPSNPSFTPIDQIPELLKKAVMTGEDPSFYGHNGFYTEAIRQSIAQNYIRKRFARGGSTISMQLVKNVFLSRRKTLARKAEEILIVWLIESQRITSKSRMFEVYLNIIEWGPGVFGIGEAAPYYFGKPAASLEPLECAYLASIVPMPKSFAYFIDSAGYVSNRNWNFIAIRNNMIRKGDLQPTDSASFNVKITGPARRQLRNFVDTAASEIILPLKEEDSDL